MFLWRIKPKDKVNSISLHELELEGVILFPRDEEYNSRERRNEGESVFGEGSYRVIFLTGPPLNLLSVGR